MSVIEGTRGWAAVAGNYVFGLTWDWTINHITAVNGKKVYCPLALLIELPGDKGIGMVGISILWFLVSVLWTKACPKPICHRVICETCHHPSHEGRTCGHFCMWDRPGGVPGNGYCQCGAVAMGSTLTTTNQAITFFALPDELPELPACAAIRVNGFVFADKRHGNCLLQIAELWPHGCPFPKIVWEYGFMTTRGRFVDRKQAMRLMLAAGRPSANKGGPDLKVSPAGYRGDELYSEDLY